MDILIVGAGAFGVSAALELQRRGHAVRVIEPGPIPHPLAASTDISKVVRMEYGQDELYFEMAEASIQALRHWNEELGETIYHHDGVAMLTLAPMEPGGFEHDSYQTLLKRGHKPERLKEEALRRRFPAWSEAFVDGFYNPHGGWVESGRLISGLCRLGREAGVKFVRQTAESVEGQSVHMDDGSSQEADMVIVAAGAWTPLLVPELQPYMRSSGHPVFHLEPDEQQPFSPPGFCTFTADIARTGWYGFPFNPRERVVKVANHGVGLPVHPTRGAREVYPADVEALREFLALALPSLADARIAYRRRCLYCDTLDEQFWIDRHPDNDSLIVATGGSGHAMKFTPVLGRLTADKVEQKDNPWLERFRWRHLEADTVGGEPARHRT